MYIYIYILHKRTKYTSLKRSAPRAPPEAQEPGAVSDQDERDTHVCIHNCNYMYVYIYICIHIHRVIHIYIYIYITL